MKACKKTTTTIVRPYPPSQPAPMQSIMSGRKDSPNQKLEVNERKAGMGGSTPRNYLLLLSLSSTFPPYFILQAGSACSFAHITQYNNNDYTSSPAMLNQQEEVVFFHFMVGNGELRPKEGQVFPRPLSKAELSEGDLSPRRPDSQSPALAPNFSYSGRPPGFLMRLVFFKTQMISKQGTFTWMI